MEIRPLQQYEPALSGEDVVDQHWPFDGPHSPQRTTDALDAIARLVRYVDNATTTRDGLGYAPQVYTAFGGLTEAIQRLPQLLDQLAQWAQHTAEDASVQHDQHRGDADRGKHAGQEAASRAQETLRRASITATMLGDQLSQTRAELAHLSHDLPDQEVRDDDR